MKNMFKLLAALALAAATFSQHTTALAGDVIVFQHRGKATLAFFPALTHRDASPPRFPLVALTFSFTLIPRPVVHQLGEKEHSSLSPSTTSVRKHNCSTLVASTYR